MGQVAHPIQQAWLSFHGIGQICGVMELVGFKALGSKYKQIVEGIY